MVSFLAVEVDGDETSQAWCKIAEPRTVYMDGVLGLTPPYLHRTGEKVAQLKRAYAINTQVGKVN